MIIKKNPKMGSMLVLVIKYIVLMSFQFLFFHIRQRQHYIHALLTQIKIVFILRLD